MKIFCKNLISIFLVALILPASVSAQSGGTFEITQSVIAGGGGKSDGGTFSLIGTSGQSLAGTNSTGGGYGLRDGFWQGFFNPTAATAAVSGRVMQTNGKGIFKARVTLSDATGATRYALTNPFGYYRFDDVEAGQTYFFSVSHRHYLFINNAQILTVLEDTEDINFTAEPQW